MSQKSYSSVLAGRVVGAAVVGAVSGLAATALLLHSFEFGLFGAVGGAIALMIGAAISGERAEA